MVSRQLALLVWLALLGLATSARVLFVPMSGRCSHVRQNYYSASAMATRKEHSVMLLLNSRASRCLNPELAKSTSADKPGGLQSGESQEKKDGTDASSLVQLLSGGPSGLLPRIIRSGDWDMWVSDYLPRLAHECRNVLSDVDAWKAIGEFKPELVMYDSQWPCGAYYGYLLQIPSVAHISQLQPPLDQRMYGIFEPVTDVPTYQSGFSQHMTAYQMMCNYMRSWALEATLDSVLSTLDRRIGWEVLESQLLPKAAEDPLLSLLLTHDTKRGASKTAASAPSNLASKSVESESGPQEVDGLLPIIQRTDFVLLRAQPALQVMPPSLPAHVQIIPVSFDMPPPPQAASAAAKQHTGATHTHKHQATARGSTATHTETASTIQNTPDATAAQAATAITQPAAAAVAADTVAAAAAAADASTAGAAAAATGNGRRLLAGTDAAAAAAAAQATAAKTNAASAGNAATSTAIRAAAQPAVVVVLNAAMIQDKMRMASLAKALAATHDAKGNKPDKGPHAYIVPADENEGASTVADSASTAVNKGVGQLQAKAGLKGVKVKGGVGNGFKFVLVMDEDSCVDVCSLADMAGHDPNSGMDVQAAAKDAGAATEGVTAACQTEAGQEGLGVPRVLLQPLIELEHDLQTAGVTAEVLPRAVPLASLLAREGQEQGPVRAVVMGCGGTTWLTAVWSGVPVLCLPTQGDENDAARRVIDAGVGARVLNRHSSRWQIVNRYLTQVLTDDRIHARVAEASALLRVGGPGYGAQRAADALSEIASRLPHLANLGLPSSTSLSASPSCMWWSFARGCATWMLLGVLVLAMWRTGICLLTVMPQAAGAAAPAASRLAAVASHCCLSALSAMRCCPDKDKGEPQKVQLCNTQETNQASEISPSSPSKLRLKHKKNQSWASSV